MKQKGVVLILAVTSVVCLVFFAMNGWSGTTELRDEQGRIIPRAPVQNPIPGEFVVAFRSGTIAGSRIKEEQSLKPYQRFRCPRRFVQF